KIRWLRAGCQQDSRQTRFVAADVRRRRPDVEWRIRLVTSAATNFLVCGKNHGAGRQFRIQSSGKAAGQHELRQRFAQSSANCAFSISLPDAGEQYLQIRVPANELLESTRFFFG